MHIDEYQSIRRQYTTTQGKSSFYLLVPLIMTLTRADYFVRYLDINIRFRYCCSHILVQNCTKSLGNAGVFFLNHSSMQFRDVQILGTKVPAHNVDIELTRIPISTYY